MFSNQLLKIKKQLSKYADIDRNDLFKECINNKLVWTLKRYNEEIDYNSQVLIEKGSARVLKAITKMQKKEDMKVLEAEGDTDNE